MDQEKSFSEASIMNVAQQLLTPGKTLKKWKKHLMLVKCPLCQYVGDRSSFVIGHFKNNHVSVSDPIRYRVLPWDQLKKAGYISSNTLQNHENYLSSSKETYLKNKGNPPSQNQSYRTANSSLYNFDLETAFDQSYSSFQGPNNMIAENENQVIVYKVKVRNQGFKVLYDNHHQQYIRDNLFNDRNMCRLCGRLRSIWNNQQILWHCQCMDDIFVSQISSASFSVYKPLTKHIVWYNHAFEMYEFTEFSMSFKLFFALEGLIFSTYVMKSLHLGLQDAQIEDDIQVLSAIKQDNIQNQQNKYTQVHYFPPVALYLQIMGGFEVQASIYAKQAIDNLCLVGEFGGQFMSEKDVIYAKYSIKIKQNLYIGSGKFANWPMLLPRTSSKNQGNLRVKYAKFNGRQSLYVIAYKNIKKDTELVLYIDYDGQ